MPLFQAFMFETCLGLSLTKWADETCDKLDPDYYKCWLGLPKHFNGDK